MGVVGIAVLVCRWCWMWSLVVVVEGLFMVIGMSLVDVVVFLIFLRALYRW